MASMLVGKALSVTFMQGRRSSSERKPLPRPSSSGCEIVPHDQDPPLNCTQDRGGPLRRTCSRRDCIALLLPISCGPVIPCSHAHATEGVHSKEELKMEDLYHDIRGKRLMSNLSLRVFSGFLLAYPGELKTSTCSLGFLGCLIFGLLFLREKQANAANATSLEDVQLRIFKAETELSSRTRYSILRKLEESHMALGSNRYISSHDAGQRQTFNVKSSNVEKEQKLTANKHMSEILEHQVVSLAASIEEVKRHCSSLVFNVDQKNSLRQGFEVEIRHVEENLQFTEKAIGKLKVATEDQEQSFSQLIVRNVAVESSLGLLSDKILNLQAEFESSKNLLRLSNSSAGFLFKELDTATSRNAKLEVKLKELLRSLQHERASFEELLIEHNELLLFSGKRADVCAAELSSQLVELSNKFKTASQLTSEQDVLDEVFKEKKCTLENVWESFCSDLERLRILENELPTLHEQLQQEWARNVSMQSACKNATLLEVSAELEGQVNIGRKLVERLEKELHVSHEALTLIRREVLDLQDRMGSRLSSQVHLHNELTRLIESQQAHGHALKKEKRAAAYARKQLMLTREVLMEGSQVMEKLQKELESTKKLIEGSKLQIASHSNQLEKATCTVACLSDDILAFRSVLREEQTSEINSGGCEETSTS